MRYSRYYSSFVFGSRLLAFWLLFFAAFRVWFVIWFYKRWPQDAFLSIPAVFLQALPLDLSMAAYLMAFPVLIWFLFLSAGSGWQTRVNKWIYAYHFLMITVWVMIFGANIFIYQDWHTLINNRAIEYMSSPSALFDSMSVPFMGAFGLMYVGAGGLCWVLYNVLGCV